MNTILTAQIETSPSGIELPSLVVQYATPVAKLLSYGVPKRANDAAGWDNYPLLFGFSEEHAPALIQMATDIELHELLLPNEHPILYAPVHAWRTLGQLKSVKAVPALLAYIHDDMSDWEYVELPCVFGLIGKKALPFLAVYLADESKPEFCRILACNAIEELFKEYPEETEACLEIIAKQLVKMEQHVENLNAHLVSTLVEGKGVAYADLIERAFNANCVDEDFRGNVDDILVEMGVKEETPLYLAQKEARGQERAGRWKQLFERININYKHQQNKKKQAQASKMLRKQQKQARKKNRQK